MPYLIALAALSLVAWAGLLVVMAVRTRNPAVRAGTPTPDLGAETPAIVDLLTGGWKLCEEAAAATVLDLASRGAIDVEEVGPELSLVRLKRGNPGALTPYEQMVYDHLRGLAGRDGVVAAGALAEGNRHAGRWWRSFRRKVIREARAKGLSQPRWTTTHAIIASAGSVVPAATIALAIQSYDGPGIQLGVGVWIVFSAVLKMLGGERGTPAGARVASHWMGVRAHLEGGRFDDKPAAAVTTYGRPFAYAAALGLAHQAVIGLPIAREADDRRAWSDYGGLWHPVTVRYPGMPAGIRRMPFFWGRRPWFALLVSLAITFGIFWMFFIMSLPLSQVFTDGDPDLGRSLPIAVILALAVMGYPIARALIDFGPKVELEGQVVRLRHFIHKGKNTTHHTYWIALDDGKHTTVKAYGLDRRAFARVNEGDVVRMSAGRMLGWVYELNVISRTDRGRPKYHETQQFAVQAPENLGEVFSRGPGGILGNVVGGIMSNVKRVSSRGLTLVKPEDIARVFGVQVSSPVSFQANLPFRVIGMYSWVYQSPGMAFEVHTAKDAGLMNLGTVFDRNPPQPVPGLGEEARLSTGVICVRNGPEVMAIRVVSQRWGPPPSELLVNLARIAADRLTGRVFA